MEGQIKNTSFDNLVNYQTFDINSSKQFEFQQSSSDPNSLSAIIKNNQLIEYHLINTQENLIKTNENQKSI